MNGPWRRIGRPATSVLVAALAVTIAGCGSREGSSTAPPQAGGTDPAFPVWTDWPFSPAEARERQQKTAHALGVSVEQDIGLPGKVTLTMVLIPAGEFVMGSPENERGRFDDERLHRVTIARPFWLGKCEVSQKQWLAVMGRNPSRYMAGDKPVEQVSGHDIADFIRKLNAANSGGPFRLPTEAEWEYACRAGSDRRYYFGDSDEDLARHAWYKSNAYSTTHPVGVLLANAWGLHDMLGNVVERVSSPYSEPYDGNELSGEDAPGEWRVLRGGFWGQDSDSCRCARRSARAMLAASAFTTGFRLARNALPSSSPSGDTQAKGTPAGRPVPKDAPTDAQIRAGERATSVYDEAKALVRSGRINEGLAKAEEAAGLWEQVPHCEKELSDCHRLAGAMQFLMGHAAEGLGHYRKAVSVIAALPGAEQDLAESRVALGTCLGRCGKHEEAVKELRQAATIFRKLPDARQEARCRFLIGASLVELNRCQEALQQFEQALTIYRTIPGHEEDEARCRTAIKHVETQMAR